MQLKLQSAMEYLMTYGWAILIIAVVLAALFQLGVFNPNTFAPKAPPGSCQVIRPYGIGNTNYISLAGTCNNQLPQYVIQNDNPETVSLTGPPQLNGANAITLSSWVYFPTLAGSPAPEILNDGGYAGGSWTTQIYVHNNGQLEVDLGNGASGWILVVYSGASAISENKWYNVVATWASGSGAQIYLNGAQQSISYGAGSSATIGTLGNPSSSTAMYIGTPLAAYNGYNSKIANLQIYNSSLSANDVSALYDEGIGGAPIDLFHLVGWWPLNGDGKDYSGNLNHISTMSGASFTGSWASTYAAP